MSVNPLESIRSIHNCSPVEGKFTCPVCLDESENSKKMTLSCNHDMCFRCTIQLMRNCVLERKCFSCPMCRHDTTKSENGCILIETPCERQFQKLNYYLQPFHYADRMKEIYVCQKSFPTLTFDDLIGWKDVLVESY